MTVMLLFLLSLKTIYKPPFKRNHKENVYFARLDKGKSFDVDAEVSKPTFREHNKSFFCAYLSPLWCCWSY